MTIVDYAKKYADLGWYVIQFNFIKDGNCSCGKKDCKSPGKHPRLPKWPELATTDKTVIEKWWKDYPEANVGIVPGKSGLLVLDVDAKHGGLIQLDLLEDEYEKLPSTLTVETGGGGLHYYFKRPKNGAKNVTGLTKRAGIDIKCDGGAIICPPSLHASKRRYMWRDEPWEDS